MLWDTKRGLVHPEVPAEGRSRLLGATPCLAIGAITPQLLLYPFITPVLAALTSKPSPGEGCLGPGDGGLSVVVSSGNSLQSSNGAHHPQPAPRTSFPCKTVR